MLLSTLSITTFAIFIMSLCSKFILDHNSEPSWDTRTKLYVVMLIMWVPLAALSAAAVWLLIIYSPKQWVAFRIATLVTVWLAIIYHFIDDGVFRYPKFDQVFEVAIACGTIAIVVTFFQSILT